MGLLNFFRQEDIDHLVEECKSVPGAVLIDVRTPAEYRDGHIPGSKNTLCSLSVIPAALSVTGTHPSMYTAIPASGAVRLSTGCGIWGIPMSPT